MIPEPDWTPELETLLERLIDGEFDASDRTRLNSLLARGEDSRRFYRGYMRLHHGLEWRIGEPTLRQGLHPPRDQRGGEEPGMFGSPTIDLSIGDGSVGAAVEPPRQSGTEIPGPETLVPPIILDLSPTSRYPLTASHSFVGGPVFSYMASAVILGMMLLGAWAYKITHYNQIADAPSATSNARPELVFVGRITGMVDCKWVDPSTEPFAGAYVPLGRKYALASGLMELTYKTGAKVILQGPCSYEVESGSGGYLAQGKLTARVETDKETKRQGDKERIAGNTSPRSLSPCLLVSPSFSVRTPTAVVTDLGTEFGVEVEQDGNTISHVFRGSVKIQVTGGDGQREMVLRENESARVEKGNGKPSITRRAAAEDSGFVQAMPPPKSVRDSEAYAELVLSLQPVVYYRMERPKKGTGPIGAKHPPGRSGQLDLSPFSRVFDSAPGGRHGELRLGNEFGSPYVPGRFGNALWLRGPAVSDRVVVPDYPKAANDRLTVAAWVMATGRPGWATVASNCSLFRKGNHTGQFRFGLYRTDGDLCARVMRRDRKWVLVREGASQPFPLLVWQHVALVADGTSLHLYRNGQEVASSPAGGGILPQPSIVGLGIGCRFNHKTGTDAAPDTPGYNFWQGRIDELAVFNQALSPESIRRLYLGKPLPKRQAEATTKTTKGEHPMNGP